MRNCLEKLPAKSRSLIDLYYYAGVPGAEIAARLDMRVDTLHRAICRLREKLRDCIGRDWNGGPTMPERPEGRGRPRRVSTR